MCQILETIRISNFIPENIDLHQIRMDNAYKTVFKKQNPISLENIFQSEKITDNLVYKWRIIFSENNYSTSIEIYNIKPVKSLKLIDIPYNFDYSIKLADRSKINSFYSLKGNCDDVILVKNGLLTDSSYANLVFKFKNQLFTPKIPLLNGIRRTLLINVKKVEIINISVEDIDKYEGVYLVNSMMDIEVAPFIEINNIEIF